MQYVAGLFEAPRYRNLARVGMMPLLTEWFASDPGVVTNVALMVAPDLWTAADAVPVPYRMLTVGVRRKDSIQAPELMKVNESFWADVTPPLRRLAASESDLAPVGAYLLGRVARNANNLGVLMEDLSRPEDAFRAYAKAGELDTNNLSAQLNMAGMIINGWKTDRADRILNDLTNTVTRLETRHSHLWALAQNSGYVRRPEAFARNGWTWAVSGHSRMAVSGIKRAVELSSDQSKDSFRQVLADMYMATDQQAESEAIYRNLLEKDPKNVRAIAGLAEAAARKGSFDEANALWERAAAAGAPEPVVSLKKALLLLAQGDRAAAKTRLEALTKANPDLLDAWILFSGILVQDGNDDAVEVCLQKLLSLRGGPPFAAAIRAEQAMRRNDMEAARSALEEARRFLPNNQKILEQLLRIDFIQNKMDQAGAHALLLLQLDPNHFQANYLLGHIQLLDREYDLAEDSLRRSLRARPTPRAMNDLAWLLAQKGGFVEAEKLVREALSLNPGMAAGHDTLGFILMKTNRPDEAEKAFERSLAITQADPGVFIHMAELQARLGNKVRAREIVDLLYERIDQLSLAEQEQMHTVSGLVDDGRARRR